MLSPSCQPEGGQNGSDGGENGVDYHCPGVFSLLCHDFLCFYWFNNLRAASIVSSDIKRRLSMTAIAFMSAGHSFSVSLSFPPKLVSLHTAAM